MTDNRTLSLCITNYNRVQMLWESFSQVIEDPRISEIVIVDDVSKEDVWIAINKFDKKSDNPKAARKKLKVWRNINNLGCYRNKRKAISIASNEFVIIFDSDNVLTPPYINRIFAETWNKDTLFAPDFAMPHFDYRSFSNTVLTKENVSKFVDKKHFSAFINTMNYFVNRDEYLRVWEDRDEPWTADTALQNYNWLKAGNKIKVLEGMQYEHRIEHTEHKSHYQEHNRKTGNQFNDVMDKMRKLR